MLFVSEGSGTGVPLLSKHPPALTLLVLNHPLHIVEISVLKRRKPKQKDEIATRRRIPPQMFMLRGDQGHLLQGTQKNEQSVSGLYHNTSSMNEPDHDFG